MASTFEVWITHFGINTCLYCAEHNGKVYAAGEGPQPPAHPLCNCERERLPAANKGREHANQTPAQP
jgi:hypothetical protein